LSQIKLGIGFEPDEEIITYYFNGIPKGVDEYHEFFLFLVITNHRIIFSNKPEFDIVEAKWIKYDRILGVIIENNDELDYLAVYSRNRKGKEIKFLFSYFYHVEGFWSESYRYYGSYKLELEDMRRVIRGMIKEKVSEKS
jgi:hypothetical protein